MPRCFLCDKVQATAEVRRVPRGFRCKDTTACVHRLAEKKEAVKA